MFEILEFNKENLALALSNEWSSPEWIIREKFHYIFLYEHLSKGKDSPRARTILIENQHISHSYQSDYVSFYALGFQEYSRFCKRIHFFSSRFSDLSELSISTGNQSKIWKSYLGFVTIKPIPRAKLGTVLLKPYPYSEKNPRHFCAIRDYEISVLNQKITIRSLPFQEQDSMVSACATTALWSAIHMLHRLFQVSLLTPSEINSIAKFNQFNFNGSLPGLGLDLAQICSVIAHLGLAPELRTFESRGQEGVTNSFIRNYIYAHLKLGVPVLMGLKLENLGQHLVTIVGFKETLATEWPIQSDLIIYAQDICEFYAHDDQVGPFSRVYFLQDEKNIETSRWKKNGKQQDKHKGFVTSIIVPIPKEIRINYEDIYEQIEFFEHVFYELIEHDQRFVWDIYLTKTSEYKQNVSINRPYTQAQQSQIYNTFLPTYIWVVRGTAADFPALEFIFDASAIKTASNYCLKVIFFDAFLEQLLFDILTPMKDSRDSILDAALRNLYLEDLRETANTWHAIQQLHKIIRAEQEKAIIEEAESIAEEINSIMILESTQASTSDPNAEYGKKFEHEFETNRLNQDLDPQLDEDLGTRLANDQLKKTWRMLIAADKAKELIVELIDYYCNGKFDGSEQCEAIQLLSARYQRVQKNNIEGVLSKDEFYQELNKINKALWDFIGD